MAYNETSSPCAITRSSQTEQEIRALSTTLDDLRGRLDMLGDKLNLVLRDPVPIPGADCAKEAALVPLADSIRTIRYRFENEVQRVAGWIDRIEL